MAIKDSGPIRFTATASMTASPSVYHTLLLSPEVRQKFKPIAEALGCVVFSWNALQQAFTHLLLVIAPEEKRESLLLTWNGKRHDGTQRSMLIEVAQRTTLPKDDAEAMRVLEELVSVADDQAEARNAFLHAPMWIESGEGEVKPRTSTDHPRALELVDKDILGDCERFITIATLLTRACNTLAAHLRNPESNPLRDMPDLSQGLSGNGA